MTKDSTPHVVAKPAAPTGRKPRQVKPKGGDAKKPVAAEPAQDVAVEVATSHPTVASNTPSAPVEQATLSPTFLSPVSKLDLAREIAAKEQAERVALASARRVDEARRKSLKRKGAEASADESGMPEKVPKLHQDDVEVLESTTVVHSTTTTLTHRRPLKQIEQNQGESATAYALRAANIRKDERSHHVTRTEDDVENHPHNEPPVQTPVVAPTAYELKLQGVTTANIYEHTTEEVEFVNSVVKDTTTRGTSKLEEAAATPVEAVDDATSNSRFYVHLAVLLVVVFTVLLTLTELYVSQLPFCSFPATSDLSNCRVCPDHGVCIDGVLTACDNSLYIAVDDTCKLSADIKRDSNQMAATISAHLTTVATAAYCQESFWNRVLQVDWALPLQPVHVAADAVTVDLAALESHFRTEPLWSVVGPRTYAISFKKAVQKLNVTTPVLVVSIWVSAVLLAFGFYTMYKDQKQSAADAALMLLVVQEELIVHTQDKGYPAAFLKNHVVDVLKLTKADAQRCYTEDTGNAVPTTTFTVCGSSIRLLPHVMEQTTAMEPTTTTKHAARPAETPVAALPPTPTVHGRASSASGAFVEGDAIPSAILKHSGVKAPRPLELPPRSFSRQHPPPRPPSPERKTLQFQSISPIKTSPVQQPSSSTQKKGISIEDDARYHDYFNPPRFLPRTTSPSTSGASCSSLSSVSKWSAAAILVGLVSMAAVLLAGLYMDSIPFCDSNATTNTPGWCQPCPDNGICFSGDLQSCKQPYLKVERACLEPSTVTRDADLMTHLLPRFLVKRASNVLCNQSLLATWQHQGTAEKTSTTSQVVTSAFELRNYLLHQAMWDNVDAAVFDVTFTKAMRQLKQGHPEYYYTSDGDVVLGRDDVDLWCALQLHVQDYVQIKRLVHAVHVALKQPSNDLVDGAVSHLRHSLWGGKNDRTWQRVVQAIHQDARIRERYIVYDHITFETNALYIYLMSVVMCVAIEGSKYSSGTLKQCTLTK
ncbi:hypothetical protein DYB38_003663 [Aphanomyces astaci]|uniref:Man1/Src1 C-terminal domain-containing protein n=1 Tax=Aphanomyces astaci TaxID=112090 RepID=A0A397E0S9_APHAT|nr:hypothetical protein DYB38_003663 [Aphanomyces astaci]